MRLLKRVGLVLLLLLAALFGLEQYAAESGEVVVLETLDDAGTVTETRLWVIDYDGAMWLRAGSATSPWAERLVAAAEVAVTRENIRRRYVPEAEPAAREAVNTAMANKYGWRETFIGTLVGGREQALPVRLKPTQ